jgi:hypothetical protein
LPEPTPTTGFASTIRQPTVQRSTRPLLLALLSRATSTLEVSLM